MNERDSRWKNYAIRAQAHDRLPVHGLYEITVTEATFSFVIVGDTIEITSYGDTPWPQWTRASWCKDGDRALIAWLAGLIGTTFPKTAKIVLVKSSTSLTVSNQ